jgi:hypothetical protein
MGDFLQNFLQIVFSIVAAAYLSWKLTLVGLSTNILLMYSGKVLIDADIDAKVSLIIFI